jgi:hypothetical protein
LLNTDEALGKQTNGNVAFLCWGCVLQNKYLEREDPVGIFVALSVLLFYGRDEPQLAQEILNQKATSLRVYDLLDKDVIILPYLRLT